ncbi:MAG: biotin/lipoyl-containing protein [Roseovarius sp.]
MPLDVIMPALGMAQDTGHIVAWHKSPGEAVAEGDVLFEVETDKATMEVEAQGAGYLTDVAAEAGSDVPVGQVIARISDTAEGSGDAGEAAPAPPSAPESESDDLPEGHGVIMPTLGMAQDTGLLVGWLKELGDAVGEDDILFEVETDKSTAEVPAGASGYLAAQLAQPGEEVPVGQVIAILTAEAPDKTVSRSAGEAPKAAAPAPAEKAEAAPKPAQTRSEEPATRAPQPAPAQAGRILASPKARRLALEQGLDLSRLAEAGYPQPYHAKDIETLKSLPDPQAQAAASGAALQLTATAQGAEQAAFLHWAEAEGSAPLAQDALWAAFACAALREATGAEGPLAVEVSAARGASHAVIDADLAPISALESVEPEGAPSLRLRDLTASRITGLRLGAPDCPALTVMAEGETLTITLDFTAAQLSEAAAISLLTGFAARLEDPLRQLL